VQLSEKVEEVMAREIKNDQELSKQIEFIKQAQQAGVIQKPQYNLASMVNVVTSA
jgi:hypothetical protein